MLTVDNIPDSVMILYYFFSEGLLDQVIRITDAGYCQVDAVDNYGRTALYYAVK